MPTVLRKPLLALIILGSTVGGSFAQLSANFTYQIACDRTVTFTNNSTGFTTANWAFGDASTSTIASPAHQYAASGTFTVTLTVSNGALYSTTSQSVTLYDPPGQSISGSVSVCANSQEIYSVASSGNNYQWTVSGGGIISGQGTSSVTVQWVSSGTGTVQLVETNAIGCTSTTTANVVIHPLPSPFFPTASDSTGGTQDRLSACFDDNKTYSLIVPAAGSTYLWEITGGTIIGSNQADNVVVHWDTEGEGFIKITETSSFGCVGSNEFTVDVKPSPIANFTTADICLGSEANFTDQSTGNPVMWHWDFGDGANSYNQFPTHIYSSPGTYDVTLIVSASPLYNNPPFFSTEACSDDTTISINVDQNPGLPLICPGTVCAGDEETYTTPVISGATYNWVVTGGTVTSGGGAADNEITIAWGNGPLGIISLQQTGVPGAYCAIPSVTEIPIVSPTPQISGPAVVCNFNTVIYDAPLLPGAVYNWTVTGGTITSGQSTSSISVYFNTIGTKTVSLNVFHDLANCGGQATKTVQVLNPFNFYANNACANTSQNYSVSGIPNPSGYTWNWTVTGGTITSGQGTGTIAVQWGSGSVGEITVDAPAGVYCNSRIRQTITIKPLPPPAPLSGALNVCTASIVTYVVPEGYGNTWTVTGGTIISGGTGNSYAIIQWGNGSSGQITLKQEDQSSWPYSPTTTVFAVAISNNTPIAISGPTTVCSNSTATYTASTSAGNPHLWQVTGGNILSGAGTNSITVQWGTRLFGSVSVTEQICNNADIITVEIITPDAPVIATSDLTCSGSSMTLYIPGDYVSYLWSTTAVDSFISVTAAGTYSVTVTDIFGCAASGSITMPALPTLPVPVASIIGAGAPLNPFAALRLTALPDEHAYLWSNGSVNQSIYATVADTYNVTVTNEFGCTDDASVVVTAQPGGGLSGGGGSCTGGGTGSCPLLFPDFTFSVCNPIHFTDASTSPGIIGYFWDFGDNSYSWDRNPIHRYSAAGSYNVTLWVTDGSGCWSGETHTVSINFMKAAFNNTQGCPPAPLSFTNISVSTNVITGWSWNFGDASTSIVQNPSHSYSTPGAYLVELVITDGFCTDTISDSVVVHHLNAAFNYQEACLGMSTLFMDNSSASRTIVRWKWNFGDGSSSTRKNPAHKFSTTGNFNVTLTVTDIAGCTSSSTSVVSVIQFNAGNISYSGPTTFCYGGSLQLTAPSGAGYSYRWSTGVTTQSITAEETGAYYVVVTDITGCKDTVGPVAILVYPPPFAYITANGPVKFCEYANYTTLTANPTGTGFTYEWFQDGAAVSTSQSLWVYGLWDDGDYTVIVTDNHGCKNTSAALAVDIYPNPPSFNVITSGPTEFCQGGNVALTAPAGYSYEWTNGSTTQSTTVFTTGRHQVTITDGNGCKGLSGENVNVKPLPDMRLVPYGCYDVCLSDSNRVYGPPGMSSYVWSNGEITQSILIDAAGTYNLTATNSLGCNNSSSNLYISTTNFLGVDLGHDTSFCDGGSVTLDAGTGFTSYLWQDAITTSTTFTANTTGAYYVNVTDSNGCEGGDTVSLIVYPNPVINLTDTSICNASTYTLDVGHGTGFVYVWDDNTFNQTRSVSASGTYSVTVTDIHTCSGSDAVTITFSPVGLGLNLGSDQSFCDGGSITFDAGNGFVNYLWQDGITTTSTFTATASGTYIVTVSDGISCSATDTVMLTVFPNPVVDLHDTIVCNIINLVLDAGTGVGYTYSWNVNSTGQTLSVTSPGSYGVTITDANACTATDMATINLAASSSPLIASATDTSICAGESVQLSVIGGTSYTWVPQATLDNPSISNPRATPDSTTEYIVLANDDSSGCAKGDTIRINVLPELSGTVNSDSSLCAGGSMQLLASGGTDYIWSPAAGLNCTNCPNPMASPVQTTDYSVTISASGYCNEDTLHVTVTIHDLPEPGLDSIITISYGSQVTFTPNGGMDDYNWTSTNGWSCVGCPNPTVSPNSTTAYTLEVTDSNGCKAFALGTVEVLSECEGKFSIPTAFSPNGDSHNDEFRIIHSGDLNLVDLKVFNRWGEIVFETTDPNKGWDGFYKGDKQDLVVFAYYAQMTCGNDVKTLVGNVTLVH